MTRKIPSVLLIGAGHFGEKHLTTLKLLEGKHLLKLEGVVVQSSMSQKRIAKTYGVPVYKGFNPEMLLGVDAVVIATPAETHFELVRACIPSVDVLVEKPLASSPKETNGLKRLAQRSAHTLMVGHIYRYHGVARQLKKILGKRVPLRVESSFINPIAGDSGRDIELEMLHPFDIIDYLFGGSVISKHSASSNRTKTVSLRYLSGLIAIIKIGWSNNLRERTLRLEFARETIVCDFDASTIEIYEKGTIRKKYDLKSAMPPLEAELRNFLKARRNKNWAVPGADEGHRIVEIATRRARDKRTKCKVAVIGAGLFGTNCAIELADHFDVTVFEKNDDILTEASHINQYRHHWGYHYPRSQETIDEIRSSISAFENRYNGAIIRSFPTYYSVAKEGSKVDAEEFLAFCNRNNLPYVLEHPGEQIHNVDKISLSLKTFEPIYDYDKLKQITAERLKRPGITMRFRSEVSGASIEEDGSKILTIKTEGVTRKESFDFVVNATYARYNNFTSWLGFPRKPIRIDVVEALWMKIDIPKISFAVMDGPFTNMVPTAKDGVFTLVHIKDSIHKRFVPKDGLVPPDILKIPRNSRAKRIIDRSLSWFPVLKNAEYLSSHYVLRGVNAHREHDDARTSDITDHGFGCYSVLGGKIIQCVSAAKEIAGRISK